MEKNTERVPPQLTGQTMVVLCSADALREGCGILIHRSNGRTSKWIDVLAPPEGADFLAVVKDPTQSVIMSDRVPAIDPPSFYTPHDLERLQTAKISDTVRTLLLSGRAPADPDPVAGDAVVNVKDLTENVLDMTAPHTSAPLTPAIHDYACYDLPVDTPGRYLEVVNGVPRDKQLSFDEASHAYFFTHDDGTVRQTQGSVTQLAHHYEDPFDAYQIIGKMRRSTNWPRLAYVHDPVLLGTVEELRGFRNLVYVTTDGAIVDVAEFQIARCDRSAQVYICNGEKSPDEIKVMWDLNGLRASNRGTEVHFQMELMLNRDEFHHEMAEVQSFVPFRDAVWLPLGMRPYRTEWRIFCARADVAGSVDLVTRLADGRYAIVDWKRSKKVHESVSGGKIWSWMRAPLDHLPSVHVASYALQLNIYRHILEAEYNMEIAGMILVQLDAEDPFYTFVPRLEHETEYIIARKVVDNHDRLAATVQEVVEEFVSSRDQVQATRDTSNTHARGAPKTPAISHHHRDDVMTVFADCGDTEKYTELDMPDEDFAWPDDTLPSEDTVDESVPTRGQAPDAPSPPQTFDARERARAVGIQHRASCALMNERRDWSEMMPIGGIDIKTWRAQTSMPPSATATDRLFMEGSHTIRQPTQESLNDEFFPSGNGGDTLNDEFTLDFPSSKRQKA